mmetsp:Transcript_105754/g.129031  ORF Transcript_105754/g.129031 Transcript_105754/m.129031 type:complete len:199 (+) Transcript_105754:41-637(+)
MSFEEATYLGFTEDFENGIPLWNAEVAFILEKYFDKQSKGGSNIQNAMISKTYEYVKKLNNYNTSETLSMATSLTKKDKKFTLYESALINNLSINSVDEAFTLIPTLKDKFPKSSELDTILNQLQDYQDINNADIGYMQSSQFMSNYSNNNDNDNDIIEPDAGNNNDTYKDEMDNDMDMNSSNNYPPYSPTSTYKSPE